MKIKIKNASYAAVRGMPPAKTRKIKNPSILLSTVVRIAALPELWATRFSCRKRCIIWDVFPHKSLYADYFWYEIGDVICIGDNGTLYYCFPKEGGDVVAKARLATEELYKLQKQKRV